MRNRLMILLGFVLFLNIFLFRPFGPVSFVSVALATALYSIVVVGMPTNNKHALWVASIAGFFMVLLLAVVTRGNEFVRVMVGLSSLVTLSYLVYLRASHIPFFRSFQEIVLSPVLLGWSYLSSLGSLVIGKKEMVAADTPVHNKSKHVTHIIFVILRSILIGIPIVGVLLALLMNADPIFAKRVKDFFDIDWDVIFRSGRRIFFSVVIAFVFAPLIALRRSSEFKPIINLARGKTPIHELTIVMFLIATVLIGFLVVQWPYVFASVPLETDLSQFGIATYFEYVRKGFIELLMASAFVYSLIWLGLLALRGKTHEQKTILPIIQCIVIAAFSLFIFSNFRRIWLYQHHHGWSLVRLYGSMFLVWIVFITGTLTARHFWTKRWVIAESAGTALLLIYFAFFNAEQFIATTHPPTVNHMIDYTYLSRMSTDGYRGWEMSYDYAEEILTNPALDQKALLTRNDRRDIAYAGLVVQNLIENYHEIMVKQGSPEEQKEYFTYVLHHILASYETRQHHIQTSTVLDENERTWQLANIQTDYLNGQKLVTRLGQGEIDERLLERRIFPTRFYLNGSYANYSYMAPYQLHIDDEDASYKKEHSLIPDSFYEWNMSERQGLYRIATNMSLATLLSLHSRYTSLVERIWHQPESQRDFDQDISHNTPFL